VKNLNKIIDQFTDLLISATEKWKLRHPEKQKERIEQTKKWKVEHPEKVKDYDKNFYLNHPERKKEQNINWKSKHPNYDKERGKIYYQNHKEEIIKENIELRKKVINLLGGHCVNPYNKDHSSFELDIDYFEVLQIDHINGGGNKEVKQLTRIKMYKKILKDPTGYQLMCPTCNWLKRKKNNEIKNAIK
jgi:hypothetical protein